MMRVLWSKRYSLMSMLLALVEGLIAFGVTSSLFPGTPAAPQSGLLRRLVLFNLILAFLSFLMGGLAIAKEQPKVTAVAALVVSVLAFLLSGLRVAV